MAPTPEPGGLQEAVRSTRLTLQRAEERADEDAIGVCVASLRWHAGRAGAEATAGGFEDTAGPLIRALADETVARWGLESHPAINQFRERAKRYSQGDDEV